MKNAEGAAEALVKAAFKKWKREENVIDDITCIIVFLDVKWIIKANPEVSQVKLIRSSLQGIAENKMLPAWLTTRVRAMREEDAPKITWPTFVYCVM